MFDAKMFGLQKSSIILQTDSYKVTHWKQYPPGTEYVYSYFESRGSAKAWKNSIFFGLQPYLYYIEGKVVTTADIDFAEEFYRQHLGANLFNRRGWEYIVNQHGGRLPVLIKAVPEGSVIPTHNVLMTIENTDPKCFWLTNYLETLLVKVWYPSTVATQSFEMKKIILDYLRLTGDPSLIDFKLHDFGYRGVSSEETAGLGGMSHLVNFMGTDTVMGLVYARNFYDAQMAGFSIPAAEHSTITSWGFDNEVSAFKNMMEQFPDCPLIAVVSDSYDIFNACENIWGRQLKDLVMAHKGTLVIRPDSGNPPEVVCDVLGILGNKFGYTVNDKKYKVLDPHVRIIQGDGIDYDMLSSILSAMETDGWSADNIAFGSGGGLLQKLNRDTMKFAFKCSSITINGKEHDVYKAPVTDSGKMSKKGRLRLVERYEGEYLTVNNDNIASGDELVEVFKNGAVCKTYTFDEVRKRVQSHI